MAFEGEHLKAMIDAIKVELEMIFTERFRLHGLSHVEVSQGTIDPFGSMALISQFFLCLWYASRQSQRFRTFHESIRFCGKRNGHPEGV